MKRMLRTLALAFVLVGAACTPAPTVASQPVPATSPVAGAVTAQKGGLEFGLPSAETMKAVGGSPFMSGNGPMMGIKPSFSAPISQAPKLESGNFELQASFPNTYGQDWGVSSVLASAVTVQGSRSVADYVAGTVLPVVKAWAEDGALFTQYTYMPSRFGPSTPHDPGATASEAAILQNAGWPLAYVSASKHEALFFYQGGQVLDVQWAQQKYTEATVPVTKAAAIGTLVAALRDPNAQAEEARTGLDFYLGVPYAGVFAPNAVNYHDDLVPTTNVPDGIAWNGFLAQDFVEKPTWYINNNGWGGGGQVDAVTGKLIRFTRLRVGGGTGGPPSPFVPPTGP